MPKEIIHDDRHLPGTDNSTPFAVEVNWGRDTLVQLGSVNLQKMDIPDARYTGEVGWFVDLDRKMINDLIRVLRKARDQAYGADE